MGPSGRSPSMAWRYSTVPRMASMGMPTISRGLSMPNSRAADSLACWMISLVSIAMMALGVLSRMAPEKLSALALRKGRHMVRSALPWQTAMAFSRQVLYPQVPQLSSSSGRYLPSLCSTSWMAASPGFTAPEPMYCIDLRISSAGWSSKSLPLLPLYCSTRVLQVMGALWYRCMTGPPMQLPSQAFISTKQFCMPPRSISSRASMHRRRPSMGI